MRQSLAVILAVGFAFGRCSFAQSAPIPVLGIVDTTKLHQEILGFGGSQAYYQNYVAHHPHNAEIYDALFGPEHGLGIEILRLQNTFGYSKPASSPGAPFDADTVEIVRHARALSAQPLTLMMSSWSPPAALKSNGNTKDGGTLIQKDGAYDYAGFARYWRDSVLAYRAVGIDPAYISIQNEPDQSTVYESCRFNPTEAPFHGNQFAGYDKALSAVYKEFQQLPSPPRLIGPETVGTAYGTLQAFVQALDLNQTYALAHHLYSGGDRKNTDTYIAPLAAFHAEYPAELKFQTEYYTPNGLDSALIIHDALTAEDANVYLYWSLAWPNLREGLLYIDNPNQPAGWKYPQGWEYTGSYFALKHYSYFIRSGYRRVDTFVTNPDTKLTAYLSPARDRLVAVAINNSATRPVSLKLGLTGFNLGSSKVFRTVFPVANVQSNTATPLNLQTNALPAPQDRFASLGSLAANGILTLPPHSIATVEMMRSK
jgi:glucuronoarabinoxylan endo-1,4-beta-xylanase